MAELCILVSSYGHVTQNRGHQFWDDPDIEVVCTGHCNGCGWSLIEAMHIERAKKCPDIPVQILKLKIPAVLDTIAHCLILI